ncbi:cyclin-dependent kinase inhibitor 1Ca [Notolabrus celidotus]|uniref:cyclin-dependent kinase inhibitor 1Ca n=1 Tax=Notolabrus celidotus TaxID=1203425 RepID=UPI00148F4D94|nr:cyclin-dependent kinase inhibitor 1Ca [Notolabrus celidotus]
MNPIRGRESVCRNLFGSVDQEQLRRDLKQRLREIMDQDSRRWNFNFQTDTPMCGRFQWEEIPADCAAAVYHESAQLKEKSVCSHSTEEDDRLSACEESAKTDQENCSSISNTRKSPAEVTPIRRKRTHSKSAAIPRNNTKITDFFTKRRRSTETKIILNPFLTSSREASLCKTIR